MNQPRGLLKLLKVDSLIHNLTDYIETRIALIKADVKDDVMKAMRAGIIYGAIAILGFFFALFLSLTIALALNALLDSWFWGFAIVTGVYLITLVVLYSLRNSEKVKNMFGDGSLQFLSKKSKDKNVDEDQQDKERAEELRKEAARREKEREMEMEHERVEIEHVQMDSNGQTRDRRNADIKIEKKEEAH